jgi:hypothetical protein
MPNHPEKGYYNIYNFFKEIEISFWGLFYSR